MVKALPSPIGTLRIDDDRIQGVTRKHDIPIFGMEEVQLSRSSRWASSFGPFSQTVHNWEGSTPLMYNFAFTLVAGVHCRTREDLMLWIQSSHAMVAHVAKEGSAEPQAPAKCHLVVGRLINTYGVVLDITCNGRPPWGVRDTLPTQVTFAGQFLAMPGYDRGIVEVKDQIVDLSASQVLRRGYNLG